MDDLEKLEAQHDKHIAYLKSRIETVETLASYKKSSFEREIGQLKEVFEGLIRELDRASGARRSELESKIS
ncbi:MAG: hypothetical protein AABZ44_10615, partial [Elusimicrobiota bacterium]